MNAGAPDLRVVRPAAEKPCATCGELTGRSYPACAGCAPEVDRLWLSGWSALSDPNPEQVADAPLGEYPWTCVDWALRQLRCAGCRGELAAGAADCVGCAAANSARWEIPGLTPRERALRTAVVVLRAPTWHRASVVSTWRLVLPFVLAGQRLSRTELVQVRTQVLAGRYDELAALTTSPLVLPLLPWRVLTI